MAYSVNIVGVQQQSVSSNYELLAVPFESGPTDLADVLGQQGTPGDAIHVVVPGTGGYQTFFLVDGPEGTTWIGGAQPFATPELQTGGAFWFITPTPRNIVMAGDVVTDETKTIAIQPGSQLLSYPYSSSVELTSVLDDAGVTAGSVIETWDPTTGTFQPQSFFAPGTGWTDPVVIEPGEAFVYVASSSFDWTVSRPYTLP